jgi:hypothetical protein
MTTKEKNKVKFLQIFNPNIDLNNLEKYSCMYCKNYACAGIGGWNFKDSPWKEGYETIKFVQHDRIFLIYTCFKGEKE